MKSDSSPLIIHKPDQIENYICFATLWNNPLEGCHNDAGLSVLCLSVCLPSICPSVYLPACRFYCRSTSHSGRDRCCIFSAATVGFKSHSNLGGVESSKSPHPPMPPPSPSVKRRNTIFKSISITLHCYHPAAVHFTPQQTSS